MQIFSVFLGGGGGVHCYFASLSDLKFKLKVTTFHLGGGGGSGDLKGTPSFSWGGGGAAGGGEEGKLSASPN